eukprot:scaffold317102_cov37-Tisochrysis_lutea.AAC.3
MLAALTLALLSALASAGPVARSASSEHAAAITAAEADAADAKAAEANKQLSQALSTAVNANSVAMSADIAASAAVVADAYAPEKSAAAYITGIADVPAEKEEYVPQPGDVVKYDEVTPGDHMKYYTGVYEGCFEDSHCFFDCPSG